MKFFRTIGGVVLFVGMVVIFGFKVFNQAAAADHPRILLAPEFLNTLKTKVKDNDPSWTKLKAKCDLYLTGDVSYPDGVDDGDSNHIGEGYQGSGYYEAILNLGSCYQAIKETDVSQANKYAQKGIDVLIKMSVPEGKEHYQNPLRDSGYGIRFFGTGMALGYDWFYEKMTAEQKKQVYTSINHWIKLYEEKGFGREHPQGNYYAGYYAAKALGALATEGENPRATQMWQDWLNTNHYGSVQPYYNTWLKGGGWPEGWNYGPFATLNMTWPIIAAKTAKGVELMNDSDRPYMFPNEQVFNLIYFSWPNRKTMDDRGALYAGDNPAGVNTELLTTFSGMLGVLGSSNTPFLQKFAQEVRSSSNAKTQLWQEFLFWNNQASTQDYTKFPTSYFTPGMNELAVRSSWDSSATWASFRAGPYTNNPGSGEEFYDQGGLAIVKGGNIPFLVNASGALLRNKVVGKEDKDLGDDLYNNNYGDAKTRNLYNIFYTGNRGQLPNTPLNTNWPGSPTTRVKNFEDKGNFVFFEGKNIEDMYKYGLGEKQYSPVTLWNRSVVYLRPDIFVVYDQTKIPNVSVDQYQGFHLTHTPVGINSDQNGNHTIQVFQNNSYIGKVTTLYPENNKIKLVDVFDAHKVYRLEVRPGTNSADQQWLTVFDVANTAGDVKSTRLSSGNIIGSFVTRGADRYVVFFTQGKNSTATALNYTITSEKTTHIIGGLLPGTTYAISLSGTLTARLVKVASAGDGQYTADQNGVLAFQTEANNIVYNNAGVPTTTTALSSAPSVPVTPPSTNNSQSGFSTILLYRLWNHSTRSEFFVADVNEKNNLLKNKRLWQEGGVLVNVVPLEQCSQDEMVKIRLFSSRVGGRFIYTKSSDEKTWLSQSKNASLWKDGGDVFCAFKDEVENSVPVYRLRNKRTSQYRYTTSLNEANKLLKSKIYIKEGVAFYAISL